MVEEGRIRMKKCNEILVLLFPLLGLSRGWQQSSTILSPHSATNHFRATKWTDYSYFSSRDRHRRQSSLHLRANFNDRHQHNNNHRNVKTSTACSMALVPLPVEDLEELLNTGVPSGPQYATYWGRTKVCYMDSTLLLLE
jgi:hypothetical protein